MLSRRQLTAGLAVALAAPAQAAAADDLRALYLRFVTAQNARDLSAVGAEFIDGHEFLWVSDGKSFWGRAATLARMGRFQGAEVWRVEPALDTARAIMVTEACGYLHLTLDLVIGAAAKPDRITFLVSMLGVRTAPGWKIAALFTTTAKPD